MTPLTLTPLTPSFFLGCHYAVTPLFSAQKTEEKRRKNGVRAKEERRNVSFRRISALLIYFKKHRFLLKIEHKRWYFPVNFWIIQLLCLFLQKILNEENVLHENKTPCLCNSVLQKLWNLTIKDKKCRFIPICLEI